MTEPIAGRAGGQSVAGTHAAQPQGFTTLQHAPREVQMVPYDGGEERDYNEGNSLVMSYTTTAMVESRM